VGKSAAHGRPIRKTVKRAAALSKSALKRHPAKKSLPKSRKAGGRRLRAKTAKKDGISPIARSKIAQAKGTRVAQIDKISAKIEIIACAAEAP
jgi:hypothetical protein